MKANIQNLKSVLSLCAQAHKCEYKDYSSMHEIALFSATIPLVADVRMILDAFYGTHPCDCYPIEVYALFGCTSINLYPTMDTDSEVKDPQLLSLALPHGTDLSNLQ